MDLVSTDTAGPLPTSHRNSKYLQLILDRATNHAAAQPLPRKSDAPLKIRDTIAAWQLGTGKATRRYHTDGARELQEPILTDHLTAQGTEITTTTPYSSPMNAAAERLIRTITDATRTPLQDARLPSTYWDWAATDATDKYNQCPKLPKPNPLPTYSTAHPCPRYPLPSLWATRLLYHQLPPHQA